MTLRQALAKSMNVATVKVGEMVGFDTVVDLAKKAGLNYNIQPTPAVALGSYDVTPLEMAGAYTIFANHGVYVKPSFVSMVRSQNGSRDLRPQKGRAHGARSAGSLPDDQPHGGGDAQRHGGGRACAGFNVPAAGKTGTSDHDGWFAGYTSGLLCIVWVGFDDNRDLDLEGAHSALPIWTEFMKRALDYRAYRNAEPFTAPDGIISVEIDPESGMLATPRCPSTISEVYISGSQPVTYCPLHGGGQSVTHVAGWEIPASPAPPADAAAPGGRPNAPPVMAARRPPPAPAPPPQQAAQKPEKPKEKKSFFKRLLGVFK